MTEMYYMLYIVDITNQADILTQINQLWFNMKSSLDIYMGLQNRPTTNKALSFLKYLLIWRGKILYGFAIDKLDDIRRNFWFDCSSFTRVAKYIILPEQWPLNFYCVNCTTFWIVSITLISFYRNEISAHNKT